MLLYALFLTLKASSYQQINLILHSRFELKLLSETKKCLASSQVCFFATRGVPCHGHHLYTVYGRQNCNPLQFTNKQTNKNGFLYK